MHRPFRNVSVGALLLLPLAACGRSGEQTAGAPEIVVYAAASTRDVLQELAVSYEAEQGVDLVFNFGSSGDLARQLVAAGRADVFLSADELEMDRVEAAGLLVTGSRRDLLENRLVVIVPADGAESGAGEFQPADLERVRRLSLADVAAVPAGRYARAWLESIGLWSRVSDRVLPAVDVRAALAAVEAGAAEAGIVYATDAAVSRRVRIVFAVPQQAGPRIVYPVARIAGRPQAEAARAFVGFLRSSAAARRFEQYGFVVRSAD